MKGGDRRDLFVLGLQFLEGLVSHLDYFFATTLNVITKNGSLAKKWGKRGDILLHLARNYLANRSGQLPVMQKPFSCKVFVHVDPSFDLLVEWAELEDFGVGESTGLKAIQAILCA